MSNRWIVRATLYSDAEVTHHWEDVASAIWHALGLMIGSFPAQSVTIERLASDE